MNKDPIERGIREKKWREARKEKGLCPKCGKAASPGYASCDSCREKSRLKASKNKEKMADNQRKRQARLKSENKCMVCANLLSSLEHKNKCLATIKAKKDKAKSEGICTYCLVRPANAGKCCNLCLKGKQDRYKLKKREAQSHYGGVCRCCGESLLDFLCLDHIEDNGNAARRENVGLNNIYNWVTCHGYPEGLQVLCFNCNNSKKLNKGFCEHNPIIDLRVPKCYPSMTLPVGEETSKEL